MNRSLMACLLMGICGLLTMSGSAQAGLSEYHDAPGYGAAWHTTGEWQRLGMVWNNEGGPKLTDADTSDDGVFWSTNGGASWGHDTVRVGQTVTFRFDMTRAGFGQHYYDQLHAWIDFDGDGSWDNSSSSLTETQIIAWGNANPNQDTLLDPGISGEKVMGLAWYKRDTQSERDSNGRFYSDDDYRSGRRPMSDGVLFQSFYSTLVVPEDAVIGETWLRARVSCHHDPYEAIGPTGYTWQGEVEDYRLDIAAVPTPSAFLLLGTGLVGLRRARRRLVG